MAALRIETPIEELARTVLGPVFAPGDPGFAEEAACFNVAVAHHPDVVVGATCAADVQAAVRWAAAQDLRVAVQATGHGAAVGLEGGVLITTQRMQDLHIDPHSRLAIIDAGVKWRRVVDEAAPFELAPLSGSSTDVGAIGYTLGGGLSVLGRTYGFASDWVVSFDVVTADGELHRATAEDNAELFWALRGGKSNVGIVTSMTIELLPLSEFYGGAIYYDGADAPKILAAYAGWSRLLPDEATTSIAFMRLPDMPDIPEPLRGRLSVQLAVAFIGDAADGDELMRPMRAVAPALIDDVGMMPFTEVDRVHSDPDHPVPIEHATVVVDDLSDEAIESLLQIAGPGVESPLLMVEIRHLGGAMNRAPSDDAVGLRGDGYLVFFLGMMIPELAGIVPVAIAGACDAMAPHANGRSFVNLHGPVRSDADQRRPWSDEAAERLARIKQRHDPEGRFSFGHWA
jgi:FAD/FMN-containing dehydrogenase